MRRNCTADERSVPKLENYLTQHLVRPAVKIDVEIRKVNLLNCRKSNISQSLCHYENTQSKSISRRRFAVLSEPLRSTTITGLSNLQIYFDWP